MAAVIDQPVTGHKGGKGGGSSHVPSEDPNTLRSAATARVIDVLGEGEIKGLVDGHKSIYYDDTPLQNEDGSYNFDGLQIHHRYGTPDQEPLSGFPDVEREIDMQGIQVKHDTPIVRTVTDSDVDAVRIKMQVSALTYQDPETGDMHGASVEYAIEHKGDNAGVWTNARTVKIEGKTTSPYQRATRVAIPNDFPIQIRVRRVTKDSDKSNRRDDTYWVSYTEIIDAKLIYPDTALIGVEIDARQFGTSIPSRKYDVYGLIVSVPSNYDPETREYSGLWDGQFKRAWTDNPAWCVYDMILNTRYGARIASADKWAFYEIAQYCDGEVEDGFGGLEPRFTFNTVIAKQSDVYTALNQMASVFRGMMYWSTNTVMPVADMPGTPVKLVTPANVINGEFEYSGTPLSQRHTVALVSYNDPGSNDRLVPEVVERPGLIEKFGWRPLEITAVACNSRGQAHRVGQWALDTEENEGETVTYMASTDHADVRPGDLIALADPDRAGARMGGRVLAPGASALTLDKVPDEVSPQEVWHIDVMLPTGAIERREVTAFNDNDVTLKTALSQTPVMGATWILLSESIEPRQFRVVSNQEQTDADGKLQYQISALAHDPTKYARVEQGLYLPEPETSLIPSGPIGAPSNISVESYKYIAGGTEHQGITVSLSPSDDARVVGYIIEAKGPSDSNWLTISNSEALSADVIDAQPGEWQLRGRARDGIGKYSAWVYKTETVTGLLEPAKPTGFDVRTGTFTIEITPLGHEPGTQWEYWMSETALDADKVESNARRVGIGQSIAVTDLAPDTTYYFYVRGINVYGASEFSPLQATTDNNPSAILEALSGEISDSELNEQLHERINGSGPGSIDGVYNQIFADPVGKELTFDVAKRGDGIDPIGWRGGNDKTGYVESLDGSQAAYGALDGSPGEWFLAKCFRVTEPLRSFSGQVDVAVESGQASVMARFYDAQGVPIGSGQSGAKTQDATIGYNFVVPDDTQYIELVLIAADSAAFADSIPEWFS